MGFNVGCHQLSGGSKTVKIYLTFIFHELTYTLPIVPAQYLVCEIEVGEMQRRGLRRRAVEL